jgi:hypothetical protein
VIVVLGAADPAPAPAGEDREGARLAEAAARVAQLGDVAEVGELLEHLSGPVARAGGEEPVPSEPLPGLELARHVPERPGTQEPHWLRAQLRVDQVEDVLGDRARDRPERRPVRGAALDDGAVAALGEGTEVGREVGEHDERRAPLRLREIHDQPGERGERPVGRLRSFRL